MFPGKKMTGHMGDDTVTTQNLDIVRIDEARQLLLVRGAVPGAKNGHVVVRPAVKVKAKKGSQVMELKLLNDQGQADVEGRRAGHRVRSRLQRSADPPGRRGLPGQRAQGTRAQKDREEVQHTTKKPWRQKGTGRARAGMIVVAAVARRWSHLPELAGRELHRTRSTRRCIAPAWLPILSQLAREGRLAVVDSLTVDAPKTKLLAAEVQGHGPGLGAGDHRHRSTTTCCWPRATWPTCWWSSRVTPTRCRWCFYKKVLVTKAAIEQIKEMLA